MLYNQDIIRELITLIATAAQRERAMADHLERGVQILRSPLLLDEEFTATGSLRPRRWSKTRGKPIAPRRRKVQP